MSIATLTTREINALLISQLESSLATTIPLLPKSFLRVIAKVIAATITILYKYGSFMFLQLFVQQASYSATTINGQSITPLIEWGGLFGIGDPTPATNAELTIDVIVENQIGVLSVGSQLIGPNNGVTYLTLSDVALSAATVQVNIQAVSDEQGGSGAGVIGNLDDGAELSFANPLPNINGTATVDSTVTQGADMETEEAYRDRVTDRFQKEPQGGAYADYEAWSEEAPGIINTYPYSGDCPGQVDIYVEATTASSGSADGIPTQAQLDTVLDDYINVDSAGLASRRQANALANTYPISRRGFAVEVVGMTGVDNEASAQTDISEALTDFFLQREPYIPGLTIPPRLDRVTVAAVSGIVDDIVSARGGIFQSVNVTTEDTTALSNSQVDGDEYDFSGEVSTLQDARFNDDGSKIYALDSDGKIYEYTVAAGVATHTSNLLNISATIAAPRAFCFNSDGSELYALGDSAVIRQWTLTTKFDFSDTITLLAQTLDVSSLEPNPKALDINSADTKFFISGDSQIIRQWIMNVAGSAFTATYSGAFYNVGYNVLAIKMEQGGRNFTVLDTSGVIRQYIMGTPDDLSYGVADAYEQFDASGADATPTCIISYEPGDISAITTIGGSTTSIGYGYDSSLSPSTVPLALTPYTLVQGEKAKLSGVTYA